MKTIYVIIATIMCSSLCAQTGVPHPKFSNFKGDAYRMPLERWVTDKGYKRVGVREEYGEWVYDYPKIAEIDMKELKVPETYIKDATFPGLDRKTQFAMVLKSEMTISVPGCYEISLNSDDGSILWIDDKKIIDNDGGHGMKLKLDSLVYLPGKYDIKVWYFQGLPDRFGIILDSKLVGRPETCPTHKADEPNGETVEVSFENTIFFESGSFELKAGAKTALLTLLNDIGDKTVIAATVIGHTDNIGSQNNNLILSQKRAEAIASELESLLEANLDTESIGLGESQPIANNDTNEGRAQNRRVELRLIIK